VLPARLGLAKVHSASAPTAATTKEVREENVWVNAAAMTVATATTFSVQVLNIHTLVIPRLHLLV
jgi:hypothetical protein